VEPVRIVASLVMGMMVLAAIAGTVSGAEEEDTCAVLFDFGNGQVMWADVPVTDGMNAFNATLMAAEVTNLEIVAPGGFVSSIGGFDSAWPKETWNLWVWNQTIQEWESAMVGAADIALEKGDAVSWSYAAYRDTTLFIPPYAPLASPEHRYPWTSFRYDTMNAGMQGFANIEHLALNWSKDLGNGGISSSVVGANGLIYLITGGLSTWTGSAMSYEANPTLFCLDMTGDIKWSKDIGAGYQIATPLLYGDMIFAPSADGKLYAFDAIDGEEKWAAFDTGSGSGTGITSSPVAYLNSIIVVAGNGKMFSINAANGVENWNITVSTAIYSSSPAITDNVIYVGDDSGNVSAYGASDGAYKWSTPVGGKVRASPLVDIDNNRIVVTSGYSNGNITALYLNNGTIEWQTEIDVTSASVSMSSEGYVAATANEIVMVDFAGDELWNYSLGETFGGAAPTVVGDTIFAVTNEESSRLVAVNMTGDLVKETVLAPSEYALCSPTFIDGFLFVTSNNGHIYAFSTGSEEIIGPGPEAAPEEFPWLLVGGIVAVILIAAVGLVFWRSKKA
jgi:outer membrane protein assembly factor BamB